MVENNRVEQHQFYLDTVYLDTVHKDIDTIARQVLDLQDKLKSGQNELDGLVQKYQQERYSRQVEIWAERNVTRCTSCFDTPQRNWGLVPPEDVYYVSIKGDHWHTSHEADYHHNHLWFHRLCNPCYMGYLKDCATSEGGLRDLAPEEIDKINDIIASKKEGYAADHDIRELFGQADNIRVYWHRLPIPEQAYEIGRTLSFDDNYKNVLRLISLKS